MLGVLKQVRYGFDKNSLKAKFLRSSFYLAIGSFVEKLLAFAAKIILARLLIPDERGIVVLIASLTALFECITEVGVKQSIIQNESGAKGEYLNAAWWLQSIRAAAIYIIAYLASPAICRFYLSGKLDAATIQNWASVPQMLQVAFLSILFNGLVSPRIHLLERQFKFKKVVLLFQGSIIFGTIITIILAFLLRNAWAMVIGFTCQAFSRLVMSFLICPFMPRLNIDYSSARELIKFARGMFGAPILTYVAYNVDIIVGAKVVSAELLGMYGFAVALAGTPRELYSRVVLPALLPVLAHQQDRLDAIRESIHAITRVTFFIGFPTLVYVVIYNKTLLKIIFGDEFQEVGVAFSLYALSIFMIVLSMVFVTLCYALGKPGLVRIYVLIRLCIISILIWPMLKKFSITGAAGVLAFANSIGLGIHLFLAKKTVHLSIGHYFRHWISGGVVGAVLIGVLLPLTSWSSIREGYALAIGTGAYILLMTTGLFTLPEVYKILWLKKAAT
ncbi:MAG: oligosaccharide flippase family protein [Sedimentisphaerales bacterium]|nr:oligosaccharide flippase family protein [Sedimentisphaerales bacterium]